MSLSPWTPEYRKLSAGIIALVSVFGFEGISVATVMPVVARELHSLGNYSVAFTSYSMAALLGMTFAGLYANRIGLYRVVMFTMGSMAVGSIIAGAAHSMSFFVIGRIIQGFGIGIDLVAMYVIIGRTYREEIRPRAIGMLAGAWVVPGLIGPGLAGLIVTYTSWRTIFLAIPFVLVLPLALLVPPLRHVGAVQEVSAPQARAKVSATVLAVLGLAGIQWACSHAGDWSILQVVVMSLCGLVAVAVSTRWLMPVGYLRLTHGIATIVGLRGLTAAAYFSTEVYVPLALQNRGVSVARSGGILATACVTWFAGSSFQARNPLGWTRKKLLVFGISAMTISIVLLPAVAFLPSHVMTCVVLSCVVWGASAFGMGIIFASLGVLVLDYSPDHAHAANSASLQMSDSFGVVSVTALTGAFLAAAERSGGPSNGTFTLMWALCAGVGLVALFAAPRIESRLSPAI